jgi:acetolactate synthase-1/2/3 large subunit
LLDSIPIVVITGQVPTSLIGTDAFQECDTIGITRHCTKHNYLVKDPAKLGDTVHEAFYLATSGRPGPVVIDLPKDVQVASAKYAKPKHIQHQAYRPALEADPKLIEAAVEMLAAAERPIFYTGGGIINSGPAASTALRELVALTDVPVTSTLMGLGAFPASDPHWLGMLGMHGTYEANFAMNQADLIVAIGSRFDDRVTGRLDAFSPHSKKIHIDIDRSSINKNVRVDLPIVADAGHAVEAMVASWKKRGQRAHGLKPWWNRIDEWRAKRSLDYPDGNGEIMPQRAIRALWEATRDRSPIISTEVGQHQMWAAQHFDFEAPNKWLTSGGLGTMGYGLPAAIGAQIGNPDALVIDIAGEASIQMNIQEMATAAQYRLPVKVFILNNQYMGMVRQWQELNYSSRYSESYSEALPDFVRMAEAFGWKGLRIEKPEELESGIQAMLDYDGPVMVDCRVAQLANCLPMIQSGAAHTEMILQANEVSGELTDEGKALV